MRGREGEEIEQKNHALCGSTQVPLALQACFNLFHVINDHHAMFMTNKNAHDH